MRILITTYYLNLTLIHIWSWSFWLFQIRINFIIKSPISGSELHVERLQENIGYDISYSVTRCPVHGSFNINQVIEILL